MKKIMKREKYELEMVLGGNIRVSFKSKYVGTYYSWYDLENNVKDLKNVGCYWNK